VNAGATPATSAARGPLSGAPRPLGPAAFCILVLGACEPAAPHTELESLQIERLAFVPPAHVALSSGLEVGSDRPLLVAQFEVTRAEWRAWYLARSDPGDPEARAEFEGWEPASGSWPASYLSLEEARLFAAARGMRLPSSSEWLRIACGSAAAPYPWGPNDAASVANTLELGLRQPTPVGTFEQGRSPFGIYDLLGNVWEWADDPPGQHEPFAWAIGGSYLTLRQPLFDPRTPLEKEKRLHLELDAAGRSNEVGLRLVAEAREWLEAHAAESASAPSAEVRLRAVGKRWGPAAAALLEELAAAHPSERSFGWLLAGARR